MQQTNVVRLTAPVTTQRQQREDATIRRALAILAGRLSAPGALMDCPTTVRHYLRLKLGQLDHEVFGVLYLDHKHRVLASEDLFRGTLTQTSVYPREVVKAALAHNAAALLLYHNHPSGVPEPSEADRVLTRALTQALGLVEVRVIDHCIATADVVYSFAEHGEF